MPLALPRAIKIDLYCEVLNINNDLGVFSIPRQASGTKNTWVIIYTLMLFLNKYIELDSWVIRHTYMAFLEKYKVLSLLLYTRIKILKVIFL